MSLRPTVIFVCAALFTSVLIYHQRAASHRRLHPRGEEPPTTTAPVPPALTTPLHQTGTSARSGLTPAALRDWAAVEPDAAATWVLSQPSYTRLEHGNTLITVLTGTTRVFHTSSYTCRATKRGSPARERRVPLLPERATRYSMIRFCIGV